MALGAMKSPKDARDKKASLTAWIEAPSKFDLRFTLTRVENQGVFESCAAHAITTSVESYAKLKEWPHQLELSRMHLWNEARQKTWGAKPADWTLNRGVYIRDAWKAAQKEGITIEKLFPYTPDNSARDLHSSWSWRWYPPFAYYFINESSLDQRAAVVRDVIYNRLVPVVFGINITSSFKNPTPGVPYKPGPGEKTSGGHAMLIVGWDDEQNAFLIMNSWGAQWGDKGYQLVDKDWLLRGAYDLSYPDAP
jgi:C1A family cysteine protease